MNGAGRADMTVQDLLRATPRDDLLDFFIPYRFDAVEDEDKPLLKERLSVWIQGLTERPITARPDVLLVHISYVEEERFAVSVVRQDEVEKWQKDGMRVIEADHDEPPSAYPALPHIYGIIMSDWDDVLALQVDENNVAQYGADRYLSEVLQEMSFHGFEEEDMVKERDELIARVDRLDAMTPEERDAACLPMEEVLRELAEEYGFEYREDTPDEIEARNRKIAEDVRREYAERYRVMYNYATGRATDAGRAAEGKDDADG